MNEELQDPDVKIIDVTDIIIPQCCREGWDSCPHVINRKETDRKPNIGL